MYKIIFQCFAQQIAVRKGDVASRQGAVRRGWSVSVGDFFYRCDVIASLFELPTDVMRSTNV